jgi:hypothetical protein
VRGPIPSATSLGISPLVRQLSELSETAFSHSSCLRDVAWIHLAYAWTKRDDVGTTSPTVLSRQNPISKQSKY